ncbi:hypothetical protein [Geotoga petraea]|uniref:Uncharacterized protein n=1 Tax=Geotoga petraea TaxID=28234 RepID=A0A4Z0W417_9BACT|nr:hypothetical protein [Geotoga petraea]TGG89297.1 hypothetical protein E4650_03665 [Geotoga petraea]
MFEKIIRYISFSFGIFIVIIAIFNLVGFLEITNYSIFYKLLLITSGIGMLFSIKSKYMLSATITVLSMFVFNILYFINNFELPTNSMYLFMYFIAILNIFMYYKKQITN